MITILEAIKAKDENAEGATIAAALGGTTIAEALSATVDPDDGGGDGGDGGDGGGGNGGGGNDVVTTEYTVAFDLNTGTGTTPDSVKGAAGTAVTLPDGTGITAPEGKEFAGWGETAAAETALESYTISKDATLYAVYTAAAPASNDATPGTE